MGRDYEAAVMSGGFIGFMLGTTANAMAVMRALVERYGPAPRGVPRRADGRRVLHRLHQRDHHHAVPEPVPAMNRHPLSVSLSRIRRRRGADTGV